MVSPFGVRTDFNFVGTSFTCENLLWGHSNGCLIYVIFITKTAYPFLSRYIGIPKINN